MEISHLVAGVIELLDKAIIVSKLRIRINNDSATVDDGERR
jgi:hypothetical protein